MDAPKEIDWKSLNGKSLKIYVTEPKEAVIGIDEETGKSYVLRGEKLFFPMIELQEIKKRRWF